MYNHFRLLTSESWNTQNRWSTIGFYPDAAESAGFSTADCIYAPAGQSANNVTLNKGWRRDWGIFWTMRVKPLAV